MQVHDLFLTAGQLPQTWRSTILGQAAGANLKVLRMDGQAYPDEVHPYDEALLVLEGAMHLVVNGAKVSVHSGQMVIVPSGTAHGVAPGSQGTLVIVDRPAAIG